MEPNWNDVKKILRQHEEISQVNSTTLQHILKKMVDMEQVVANIKNLFTIQTRRIDGLEKDCQYLRSLVFPQHLNSASINQGAVVSCHKGNTNEDLGGRDTTLRKWKKALHHLAESKKFRTMNPFTSKCSSKQFCSWVSL